MAYLDWSGLRPMSELEYEKACRGTRMPVPDEFPWGTTTVTNGIYTLSAPGAPNEAIATGYGTAVGNANYAEITNVTLGPLRTGIFAAAPGNTGRVTAGATYYGIMDMGGSVLEKTVNLQVGGSFYTGVHGDGSLTWLGMYEVGIWPAAYAAIALKGGSFNGPADAMRTSDRAYIYAMDGDAPLVGGGRGVRTAP